MPLVLRTIFFSEVSLEARIFIEVMVRINFHITNYIILGNDYNTLYNDYNILGNNYNVLLNKKTLER